MNRRHEFLLLLPPYSSRSYRTGCCSKLQGVTSCGTACLEASSPCHSTPHTWETSHSTTLSWVSQLFMHMLLYAKNHISGTPECLMTDSLFTTTQEQLVCGSCWIPVNQPVNRWHRLKFWSMSWLIHDLSRKSSPMRSVVLPCCICVWLIGQICSLSLTLGPFSLQASLDLFSHTECQVNTAWSKQAQSKRCLKLSKAYSLQM